MIPHDSYVVVVNDRIYDYYPCVLQAIQISSKLARNGASVSVENLQGDTIRLYYPSSKGHTCKQHS